MPEKLICPSCASPLSDGYLYVRGLGASLHWSSRSDVGFLSRSGLAQIDLGEISQADVGAQAVVRALRCDSCDSITFRARS